MRSEAGASELKTHPKYSLSIHRASHSPKPLAIMESTTAVVIPTNSPNHQPIHPAMVMSRKLRIPFKLHPCV